MRIWTGTTGAPATPTLGEHHRPPTPDAGSRGPAPSGRTSPPFSRRPSASGKQRFKQTLARRRAKRPAHPPPPCRGQRPICYREDHTPRTRDQGSPRPTPALRKGRGGSPPAVQKPPGHRGHIAAAGTRRERTKGGHRDDRDLQPPEARWPAAHRHALLDAPATGTPHGVRASGTTGRHLTAPLPG